MDRLARLQGLLLGVAAALAVLPGPVLAHEGHQHEDGSGSGVPVGVLLLGIGLSSVAGAIAIDYARDVPREYAGVVALGGLGLAVGGFAVALL